MPITKRERNAIICVMYKGGQTAQHIAEVFNVSEQRIGQILRTNGITMKDRARPAKREEFLGVNLSTKVKAALLEESIKRNKSMSALVSEVLVETLAECGHKL